MPSQIKIANPLYLSLLIILLVWTGWYVYTKPESLSIIREYWQISLTMVFGSLIAGGTSEGGGAIAFPVFTKLLRISPQDAKIFSLAIQSVGMTAASITIIAMRIAVEWRMILWAGVGGIPGIILGSVKLAPLFAPEVIRMCFTAMVVSFAFTLIVVSWNERDYNQVIPVFNSTEKIILLLSGFIGGIMSGLVGNGIDIVCFSVMVLLFRMSEKVATPTSVILMACNALIGFALHAWYLNDFNVQIQHQWLAAVPVVVVGAPLGAFICSRMNNKSIVKLLIALIIFELISSLWIIPLSIYLTTVSLLILSFFCAIYFVMWKVSIYCVD